MELQTFLKGYNNLFGHETTEQMNEIFTKKIKGSNIRSKVESLVKQREMLYLEKNALLLSIVCQIHQQNPDLNPTVVESEKYPYLNSFEWKVRNKYYSPDSNEDCVVSENYEINSIKEGINTTNLGDLMDKYNELVWDMKALKCDISYCEGLIDILQDNQFYELPLGVITSLSL